MAGADEDARMMGRERDEAVEAMKAAIRRAMRAEQLLSEVQEVAEEWKEEAERLKAALRERDELRAWQRKHSIKLQ